MLELSSAAPFITRKPCLSKHHRRITIGVILGCLIALSWAGGAHLLRALHLDFAQALLVNSNLTEPFPLYSAPLFTAWLCTALNALFFPAYLTFRFCEKVSLQKEVAESMNPFHERSISHLFFWCCLFSALWMVFMYMLVQSLSLLDTTDVVALYITLIAFVYLLSWVLLQEQFVGIRIIAVILCNTSIALFAYMDVGHSRTSTLGGVVLAAAAAAGTAVYKVLFKKVVGAVTIGQISFFLSLVGLTSSLLAWPFFLALYFTGLEIIEWNDVPWLPLLGAAFFILLANMLGNFGLMWTYEVFLSLGFMFSVPTSAVLDMYLYSVLFSGMKLAGTVLSMIGFCLILLPDNWPDYFTRMLQWRWNSCQTSRNNPQAKPSYTSRLRTHSGRVK